MTDLPGAPAPIKRCPACAEEIQAGAVVCRYCGFDYASMSRSHPITVQFQAQKTNSLAIASFVLGILWIYWGGSILALIFGYSAKTQIDRSNRTQGGRGLAVARIVLGWVGVGTLVLSLLLFAGAYASGPSF